MLIFCRGEGWQLNWQISKADIRALALGAKFLACGGGGDTFTTSMLLESEMTTKDKIIIKTFSQLETDFVLPIGAIGSSMMYLENIPTGDEGLEVLKYYEVLTSKKVTTLIPYTGGGANALIPLVVALQSGLPVVDGDGTGRTFSELFMNVFNIMDIPIAPIVLINYHLEKKEFYHGTNRDLSTKVREWIDESGGYAHFACYGTEGEKIKTAIIPGTLKMILELGKTVIQKNDKKYKLDRIFNIFSNSVYGQPKLLIEGRIESFNVNFNKGLMNGNLEISGKENFSGQTICILFQNEFFSVIFKKSTLAIAPDLILILNVDSLHPCLIDDLEIGMNVLVLSVPVPTTLKASGELR